jgi:flagellin-like protein
LSSTHADRGSAGVLGALLLVVVTVVATGLVGSAALDLARPVEVPPAAAFSVAYVADGEGNTNYRPYLVITHEAGNIGDGTRVFVVDDAGNRVAWTDVWTGGPQVGGGGYVHVDGFQSDGALRPVCEAGQTYSVVAEGRDGRSFVIRQYVVPHDPVLRHDEVRAACGV